MGKSTISMAIFNSYVKLPEGNRDSTGILDGFGWDLMGFFECSMGFNRIEWGF
jgi:hypothetical protein